MGAWGSPARRALSARFKSLADLSKYSCEAASIP